jgi:hypothetical protein
MAVNQKRESWLSDFVVLALGRRGNPTIIREESAGH